MARIRIGHKERDTLVRIHERSYLLVPSDKEESYRPLERKGCITMTVSRSHKTLRTGRVIVDIWHIALTPMGRSIAETAQRDALADDIQALFNSAEAGDYL